MSHTGGLPIRWGTGSPKEQSRVTLVRPVPRNFLFETRRGSHPGDEGPVNEGLVGFPFHPQSPRILRKSPRRTKPPTTRGPLVHPGTKEIDPPVSKRPPFRIAPVVGRDKRLWKRLEQTFRSFLKVGERLQQSLPRLLHKGFGCDYFGEQKIKNCSVIKLCSSLQKEKGW